MFRSKSQRIRRPRQALFSRGFTLVEILVAIGIISILVTLLFPQAVKAVENAKAAKCVGNLRQLGQGIMLYTADHDGALPPTEEGGDSSPGSVYPGPNFGKTVVPSAPTWAEYIYKIYLANDPRPLSCPSKPASWTNQSRGNHPEYGYNQRLSPINPVTKYREGMKLAAISQPSRILLLGDSGAPNGKNPTAGIYRIYDYLDLHPRHPNSTVNVLFVDLHAEAIKLDFDKPPAVEAPLGRDQFAP